MQYTFVDILLSFRYLRVWKFIDTVRRNLILVTTESERVTYRKLINIGQGKTLGFPGGCKACLRCKTVISYVARNEPNLPPLHGGRDISRDGNRREKQTKIYEMRKEIFFDIIIVFTYISIFILLIYLFVYVFLVSFQGQLNKIKWYIQDLWKTT